VLLAFVIGVPTRTSSEANQLCPGDRHHRIARVDPAGAKRKGPLVAEILIVRLSIMRNDVRLRGLALSTARGTA
jgi:hypothetical protein